MPSPVERLPSNPPGRPSEEQSKVTVDLPPERQGVSDDATDDAVSKPTNYRELASGVPKLQETSDSL